MALDIAKAEQTPLPDPDISSPSSNFENLSFIISISIQIQKKEEPKERLSKEGLNFKLMGFKFKIR